MYSYIQFEKREGVGILTLNRPEKFNGMNDPLIAECIDAIQAAEADSEIGALLVTGAGKAFCAGGDINEMRENALGAIDGYPHMKRYHAFTAALTNASLPVIGAVNGVAAGGGLSLVLMCDVVYASSKAKFRSAFQNIALVPDLAITYRLPLMVGLQRAYEIIYSDRIVLPEEALQMGLISRICEPETLMDQAFELAKKLANGPKIMLSNTKRMLNLSAEVSFDTLLEIEAHAQTQCFCTEDHAIAAEAFVNKRAPVFTGR